MIVKNEEKFSRIYEIKVIENNVNEIIIVYYWLKTESRIQIAKSSSIFNDGIIISI